ncbi:Urea active transporter [Wickerhamomyces ciferrii]|uniref:Urea active transporter n=1 Tax=Wickerhamomyces ciferrii (strain ATCC 14091 / BCRC 22168 / CBS 111 / JCM 3599 / NBRC 0793 / NRRL Y-1031 F-60-10) TaxID=1206466 RepID=K0KRN1_WICCF|nr:Urea active transporter [Wickerhamomyces ciferrii]CCH43998.1 Urea active transporter [Wickerhamomyces ciferrii]
MLEGYPLPQGAGYAILVGLGAVFALGMIAVTAMLRRYQKEIITAEEFATAGRSVNTSLIAAAVVSSWTWAATLLQSTTQAYKNGISGGFWYASGACVQVILFSALSIKSKQIAPGAHTYLEIIKCRYGKITHLIYTYFAVATNILVTAMLLAGGSATVNFLTGMHPVAAIFLLPLGTIVYTLFGGIKATFLTDYVHTIVIVVIIFVFAFAVYASSPLLGSPGVVYDKLTELAKTKPIEGNHEGSYLTFNSKSGGLFFVINIVGNFGTVFLDQGYWNKAIAASPAAALPGYVLGGLAWFAIPALISTTLGLACRCLEDSPSFMYYPNGLSNEQVAEGLVLPVAAYTLLGKGGAMASLLLVFMAVTSAMSAELIAASSLFTYDIYKSYINPQASGKKLIMISHATCIGFGASMIGFSIGLHYGGVSMGFLYELMGVIISSAVLPASLTIFWSKQNWMAATISPVLGSIVGLISWIASAKSLYGSVTYDNLFEDHVMLIGNIVSLLSPAIFIPILTFAFKHESFDWEILKSISRVDETEEILSSEGEPLPQDKESGGLNPITSVATIGKQLAKSNKEKLLQEETEHLAKSAKYASWICAFFALAFLILWPMPLYGSKYIFSKKFFTGWITVLLIWLFFTAFMVCIYPLWEGRFGIFTTCRGLYWDLTGQTYKLREWQNSNPDQLHVVKSQISNAIHEHGNSDDDVDKIRYIDDELKQ